MRVLVPVVKVGDKMFLSPHFGRAPGFAVFLVGEGGVELVEYFENPYRGAAEHSGHGRAVLELVQKLKPDAVIVSSIGAGAFYRLTSAGVRVYRSSDRLVEDALAKFSRGELPELREPYEHEEHE